MDLYAVSNIKLGRGNMLRPGMKLPELSNEALAALVGQKAVSTDPAGKELLTAAMLPNSASKDKAGKEAAVNAPSATDKGSENLNPSKSELVAELVAKGAGPKK